MPPGPMPRSRPPQRMPITCLRISSRASARGKSRSVRIRDLPNWLRSEEHTSELQSPDHLVCRLLLEKKKKTSQSHNATNTTNRLVPYKSQSKKNLMRACKYSDDYKQML